jgi:predicted GIY-YIG superfamily endonuclease
MREHSYWVYIVASGRCGWLYVGMTNDLIRRIGEHRHGQIDGYSREHGTDRLVWYEIHPTREAAFKRERQIKKWNRVWKLELIEKTNPGWDDLHDRLRLGDLVDAKDWVPASAGMSGKEDAED